MNQNILRTLLLTVVLMVTGLALAAEPLVFTDADQEARFKHLTTELRCLVCQNQNLADSDAELAQDLRKEIHDMLQTGQTDDEIKTFMIDRYGDFVLYRPPMKSNTIALWLMPAVLLLIGGLVLVFTVRKRSRLLAEQEKEKS
jgi:cytochrome c-type biogenesis protein CcmH